MKTFLREYDILILAMMFFGIACFVFLEWKGNQSVQERTSAHMDTFMEDCRGVGYTEEKCKFFKKYQIEFNPLVGPMKNSETK